MKINYPIRQIFLLLFLPVFINSCNGQVKTTDLKERVGAAVGHPKIRKTQGANEYQNIHCGLQDRAGNLWFGTTGEGVYRFDGKLFIQYTVKDGLSSNTVWSILEDTEGNIWFGTDAGVCRYDGKAINYIPFSAPRNFSLLPGNTSGGQSAKNAVGSIMQDKRGMIWFGADDGLYRYDGKTFTTLLNDPGIVNDSDVTLRSIQCMLEDKEGNIWMGSGPMAFEGICRYDGKSIQNFKPKNVRWVRSIIEEQNGDILFATRSNGVCLYNGKKFTYITQYQGKVNGSMMSCLKDKSGNTWFASDYGTQLNDTVGGAWRFDGRSFIKYSTKDGLTNNAVFLILDDREGNIWVGTRNIGLYRFNGKTFDNFSE